MSSNEETPEIAEDVLPEEIPEEEIPDVLPVMTAFTVVVDAQGRPHVVLDPRLPDNYVLSYRATSAAVKAACIEVADDIRAGASAEYVIKHNVSLPDPSFGERVLRRLEEARRKQEAEAVEDSDA